MRTAQIGLGLLYVAAVVALDDLSSVGIYRALGVAPWNPSVGLSVALAYVGGFGFAPFILFAHWISQAIGHGMPWPNIWSQAIVTIGEGAIYLGAGLAMRRWSGFDPALGMVRDCVRLIGLAVLTAVIATLWLASGMVVAGIVPDGQLIAIAWRVTVGTLLGMLTITPLVLMIVRPRALPSFRIEHVVQTTTVVLVTLVIFGYPAATAYQFLYLLFVPVLWVSLRDGIGGSVLVINVCQIAIIFGAQARYGVSPGLAPLQTLLLVLVISGLLVGAVVTERQASAQRLREQHGALNRALRLRSAGEAAAAIAHEINQPLTALNTYASVVQGALERGEYKLAADMLAKVRQQCDRAANVVASMRELVSHGHLAQEPVDLAELVAELSELHRDDLAAKGVQLSVDIPRNLPRLMLDPTQMQQALHNLLNNSLEAMTAAGQRGTIRINARLEGGTAAIVEVSDNGPGFPQGFEELACTPFMTTKQNGSGLGLAVARSVAEAHGGSLTIAPCSLGAMVSLKLPIIAEERWRTS